MKLPADFQKYLDSFSEKKLFVTSLDRKLAQIYPLPLWREIEKRFSTYREKPIVARSVAFNANDLGGEAEVDAQGRVLFPPELRKELGIENQQVRIYAYRGRIEVLSDAIYQQQKQQASINATDNVNLLEEAGIL